METPPRHHPEPTATSPHGGDEDGESTCDVQRLQPPSASDDRSHAADASDSLHQPNNLDNGHTPTTTPDAPPFFHTRTVSTVSYQSMKQHRPAPILLEDHSEESHEQTQACWAQSVTVDDYILVTGATGIGAYVVWHCTVRTLAGGDMAVRKRYSEFDRLRTDLVRSFPHAEAMIPPLPRKSVVSRFRPDFLAQRKAGLEHFVNCILLNPEFAASPVLKDFVFT